MRGAEGAELQTYEIDPMNNLTYKQFRHFFGRLWHSYHARYKMPYAHDDCENFARRIWNFIGKWAKSHE